MTYRVIFAHDHYFDDSQGYVTSESQFDYSVWSRYTHFGKLLVIGRKATRKVKSKTPIISSGPLVEFKLLDNISGLLASLKFKRKVSKAIENEVKKADMVVCRLPSEIGLIAAKYAQKHQKACAIEVVGCAWDAYYNYGSMKARLYAPLAYLKMKRAVSQSANTLYVTEKFLQSRYPSLALNTCIASNVQLTPVDEYVLKRRLENLTKNKIYTLGFIGSLGHAYKGLDVLLKALFVLKHRGLVLNLRVLGPGDQSHWKNLVEKYKLHDWVSFDGVLPPGEEVQLWLDNIDLYVHPSRQEGLPRALIEAMSRGCPAIASNLAGIPELLDKEFLISVGNSRQLAVKIEKLLADNVQMQVQASRNFYKVSKYHLETLSERRRAFLIQTINMS